MAVAEARALPGHGDHAATVPRLRTGRHGQLRTVVTGSEESAPSPSEDGSRPRATICAPRAAIIAPLSVHYPGRGTRRRMPAASQRSCAMARSREFAATPPPTSR